MEKINILLLLFLSNFVLNNISYADNYNFSMIAGAAEQRVNQCNSYINSRVSVARKNYLLKKEEFLKTVNDYKNNTQNEYKLALENIKSFTKDINDVKTSFDENISILENKFKQVQNKHDCSACKWSESEDAVVECLTSENFNKKLKSWSRSCMLINIAKAKYYASKYENLELITLYKEKYPNIKTEEFFIKIDY